MNKVYKSVEEFLIENMPRAYLEFINERETSLQYQIDKLTDQFNKDISEILKGNKSTSNNNQPVHAK